MAKQTQQEKRKQKLIDELLSDYDGPESFCVMLQSELDIS